MRKRIQKISIFLGIFLIALVCGALLFVRSETFLNWVEQKLETELKNRLTDGYAISVGNIEGSVLGNVTISNVEISEISKADEPVISTEKVVLKYNLLRLLRRRFEATELKVDAPEIRAKTDLDGKLNLSNIFRKVPSNEDAPQFSFAIENVRLERGKIDYTDPQRDLEISVQGITINVVGPLDRWDHDGNLEIETGSFAFNGYEMPIDKFEVYFEFLATRNRFELFRLDFGNSRVVAAGQFPHRRTESAWSIDLDLQRLDMADIAQFLGEDIKLDGILKGSITANGIPDSSFAATLNVETPTLAITQVEHNRHIALTDLKIDAGFNLHPIPTLTLKTFSTQIADGTLTGNGTIGLHNRPEGDVPAQLRQLTTHPLAYTGAFEAIDVQLIPLLSMFGVLPEFLVEDSTGHLSGNATFNGSSTDISTLNLNSTLGLTDTVLNTIALKDSTLNCKIEDGVLKTDGNLDGTVIAVTGPFPLTEQDALDIHVSNINFDDLMKIVNSADLGGTGEYTAKLASDGKLNGYIEIPNASFIDIPIGILAGNLNYHDGQVFIENGRLTKNTINEAVTAYASQTTITGVVDVEGEFPAQFSVIANPVYVQHYPKVLLGAEYPVTGEISGELKLDGTLINLDGRADFSVTEGIAWGIHLDPLTLPLRIEDYYLTLPDVKITTHGQEVTLNVAVAPNADFDFRLQSDAPVNFQELSKAAQISDFPFDGRFDVSVIGTFKKPQPLDFQIALDFKDITYIDFADSGQAQRFPLGEAVLHGKLVELKNTTGEADRFDFTGNGFSGQIQGYVSMALDNPYKFIVETDGLEVRPLLRILHPAFETITGRADGRAQIEGTVTDLVTSPDSDQRHIFPYKVDVKVDTSRLQYGGAAGRAVSFTNAEQIQIRIRDDIIAIDALSLRTLEDISPFIALTGTFDARRDTINLHAKADRFALSPFAPAVGLSPDAITAGTGHYIAEIGGTSEHPTVVSDWVIPKLDLKTEFGNVHINDAGGTLDYRNDVVHLEKTTLQLLGNTVDIAGNINVNPEDINNSQLHLTVNAPALEMTTFAEWLPVTRYLLPVKEGSYGRNNLSPRHNILTEDREPKIENHFPRGVLATSIDITGTLAETLIALHAQTAPNQPIHLVPYANPIILANLNANATLRSDALHIQSVKANGQIGEGRYEFQGGASFSIQDVEAMQLAMNVSVSELEVSDFITLLSQQVSPIHGTASGYAKLNGNLRTGLHHISIIGGITELHLHGYDTDFTNRSVIEFQSDQGNLNVHFPLALKSPEVAATTDIRITGAFEAPEITAEWNGNIAEMEWNGDVEYCDERITVNNIELKNRAGTSTITGIVPFNLAFTAMDISDRFPEQPIGLHFQGRELPLDFFPGIGKLFSTADGTVDIDLAAQGTSRNPHITGDISLEASQLQLKNFHEPIQNVKLRLNAKEGRIDLAALELEMEPGYCTFEQGQLVLDGLVPKEFRLTGLRFERFPLGATVQHAMPPEVIEDVEGHLSMTLTRLTIPFDHFLAKIPGTPLPQIHKTPSLRDLAEVSSADLSINSVQLAFKVIALDREYDFQDPRPIPMSLTAGTLTLPEAFILENQETFSIKQTFTEEDEKPEDIRGDVHTIEAAKTTLTIDGGSQWSVNGEFDTALRFKNFDVSAITRTWDAPYRVNGALSGTLQMSGTSEDPKITFRRHESEPAELYLDDIPIDLRWRVRYQYGKWEISKRRYAHVNFGENTLIFSGTLPYQLELIPFLTQLQRAPETVWKKFRETDIEGTLDIEVKHLDVLQSLVPDLQSPTGTSSVRVAFTGTIEAPQALGAVRFENIGFHLPSASMHVGEATGRVALTEQGATVEALSGRLNDGTFSVTGSVKTPPDGRVWENLPTLDLQASIASTTFEQSRKYQIVLDDNPSQFHLKGEFDAPKLTGNLNIRGGYYEQNWETVRDWLVGASVSEMDVLSKYPILRDLKLEVYIDIADNFEVRSSIAGPTDIQISCTGKLIGPIQEPIYNGNVSVLSGKIALVPQTFEFIEDSNSSITNRSLDVFNPELNLFLRTPNHIRGVLPRDQSTVDLEIYATFTGTLSNPDLTLSAPNATEVLTEEDIWAFLVRNISFSHAFGAFTFNLHRLRDAGARSVSAEYQLRKNMSIKIESNENGEYGADFEIKGRF